MRSQAVLRPDYGDAAPSTRARSLIRAVASIARLPSLTEAEAFAARQWPRDHDAQLIARGAVVSSSFATTPTLGSSGIADLADVLGPRSAASQVFARSLGLQFESHASLFAPGLSRSAVDSYTAEGSPIAVVQSDLSAGVALIPLKLTVITSMTREVLQSRSSEQIIRTKVGEGHRPVA